jgi:CheY-like chemotaxis protein
MGCNCILNIVNGLRCPSIIIRLRLWTAQNEFYVAVVFIPFIQPPAVNAASLFQPSGPADANARGSSANIVLVADDNAYVRHSLCERFQSQADFAVCGEAKNGKEAIDKARQLRPDLIVLDLSIPVMNGLEAARALTHIMPDVPLIMFSSTVMHSRSRKLVPQAFRP